MSKLPCGTELSGIVLQITSGHALKSNTNGHSNKKIEKWKIKHVPQEFIVMHVIFG